VIYNATVLGDHDRPKAAFNRKDADIYLIVFTGQLAAQMSACHSEVSCQNHANYDDEIFAASQSKSLVQGLYGFSEIRKGPFRSRALNERRVGKTGNFQPISRRIS